MSVKQWSSIDAHHRNMAEMIVASGPLDQILPLIVSPPGSGVIQFID